MQIQKQVGKKVGKKVYPKYVVVIPEKLIKKAGFKAKDKLEANVKKGEIQLRKL
jgi:bifunctional DNA-binding transcriptional regulator/antitoxin component of YhaV-PrlF toxin-antitoxin module